MFNKQHIKFIFVIIIITPVQRSGRQLSPCTLCTQVSMCLALTLICDTKEPTEFQKASEV